MKSVAFTLYLLAGLSIIACGTGSSDEEIITVNVFEERLCETRVACGVYLSIEDCVSAYDYYSPLRSAEFRGGEDMDQIYSDIEAGVTLFNSASAQRCLKSIVDQGCTTELDLEACGGILEGTRAIGESCFSNTACVGNSVCDGERFYPCESGVCVEARTPSALGEFCGIGASCEEDLFCPSHLATSASDPMTCVVRQPIGSECVDSYCVAGAYCDVDDNECKPLPVTGEACEADCASLEDYCHPTEATCQKRFAMNDECVETTEALFDHRFDPCPISGHCWFGACYPFTLDDGCGNNGDRCITGQYCTSSTCKSIERPNEGSLEPAVCSLDSGAEL